MTIKELMKELSKYDENIEVKVEVDDECWIEDANDIYLRDNGKEIVIRNIG